MSETWYSVIWLSSVANVSWIDFGILCVNNVSDIILTSLIYKVLFWIPAFNKMSVSNEYKNSCAFYTYIASRSHGSLLFAVFGLRMFLQSASIIVIFQQKFKIITIWLFIFDFEILWDRNFSDILFNFINIWSATLDSCIQ